MVCEVLVHRNVLKRLRDAPENVRRKFGELVEELKFNPVPSEKFDIKSSKGERTRSEFVWASTG
ncbi:hypothetical protein [Thermococcus camini]|uniref:Uncharacterized protein n=1 Tax=Thermococcus camini TaxID=2016373 RepID=A0A7G2D713_9EURY|nr:hypothetical protein [Thermococcus camini]CAD5244365.1 conserved protein of unknown function [Thermococcus camini]